jgi:hypothetical protein
MTVLVIRHPQVMAQFYVRGVMPTEFEMETQNTITVPDEVHLRVQHQAEVEGKTVDELMAEALKSHLARRTMERFRREADLRRREGDQRIPQRKPQSLSAFRHSRHEYLLERLRVCRQTHGTARCWSP